MISELISSTSCFAFATSNKARFTVVFLKDSCGQSSVSPMISRLCCTRTSVSIASFAPSAYFNQDTWPQNGNMTAPNSWQLPCHIGVGGIVCRCGAHAATLLGPKWPQRHRLVVEGAQVSLNINSLTSNTFDQIQLSDMGHHCHLHSTIVNNSQHDIAYDITLLSLSLWYKKPQG